MQYPGRIIKVGEKDAAIVKAVKKQLNKVLVISKLPDIKLDAENGNFGPRMKQVVQLFQTRNVDNQGNALKADGQIGSLTWQALFGTQTVVETAKASDAFLAKVLAIAAGEEAKAVREQPKNSNRGPQVDEYLFRSGVHPGLAWCCAFVYWCFDEAALANQRKNPMVKTAGCMDHWNRSAREKGARRIAKAQAVADPSLIKPGMIFILDHGQGLGHTGLVERVSGGLITTIEGNTDASKTREGGGVYRLSRKIADINKGFIDYAGL